MINSSADGTGGALVVHAPIFTNVEKRTEIGIDNQLLLCPPPKKYLDIPPVLNCRGSTISSHLFSGHIAHLTVHL